MWAFCAAIAHTDREAVTITVFTSLGLWGYFKKLQMLQFTTHPIVLEKSYRMKIY